MRMVKLTSIGGPDALEMYEQPTPNPGPRDVLIRLHSASLNYRDVAVTRGGYPVSLPDDGVGSTLLSDGAGEVVGLGAQVSTVQKGDRVAITPLPKWQGGRFQASYHEGAPGFGSQGMLAEFICIDEQAVVRIPDYLEYEEAAALPCAAVTAWVALTSTLPIAPGDTFLTLGSGGVSSFALQFGKDLGARGIVTTGSPGKTERLHHLGADAVIDYQATPNWEVKVRELTHGLGVDRVIETGGATTVGKSIAATAVNGRVCLVGFLGGFKGPGVDMGKIQSGIIAVDSISMGSRSDFLAMLRAMTLHRIHPHIDRVFPFDQYKEAFKYMESGAFVGKVAIRI